MTTRRQFVLHSLPVGAALMGGVSQVRAAAAPLVAETDPVAVALGYKHDATKVDAKKYPAWQAGRLCNGCQLFLGKPADAQAPCSALANKVVSAKGWCTAWAKKA